MFHRQLCQSFELAACLLSALFMQMSAVMSYPCLAEAMKSFLLSDRLKLCVAESGELLCLFAVKYLLWLGIAVRCGVLPAVQ